MKLLELFSGSAIMSKTFEEHGHEVFTVDNNKRLNPSLCIDFDEFTPGMCRFHPDVIWASPPCTTFSVASISTHWMGGNCKYIPKTELCFKNRNMVIRLLSLIAIVNPRYYFIENPVGVLRKLDFMQKLHKKTVTYCQYGDKRMKPTDIWTNAFHWIPKPRCYNNDKCHVSAPRGSKTGTQGLKNNYERSKLPKQLCEEILQVCEGKQKVTQKILN